MEGRWQDRWGSGCRRRVRPRLGLESSAAGLSRSGSTTQKKSPISHRSRLPAASPASTERRMRCRFRSKPRRRGTGLARSPWMKRPTPAAPALYMVPYVAVRDIWERRDLGTLRLFYRYPGADSVDDPAAIPYQAQSHFSAIVSCEDAAAEPPRDRQQEEPGAAASGRASNMAIRGRRRPMTMLLCKVPKTEHPQQRASSYFGPATPSACASII